MRPEVFRSLWSQRPRLAGTGICSFIRFLALCASLVAAVPDAARAQVIADNLIGTDNVFAGPSFAEVFAQQFTVTSGNWDLAGIEAEVGDRDPSVITIVARLYTDAGNTVGAPLTTLSLTGNDISTVPTSGTAVVTFIPDTPVTLEPGSSYWFALGPTNAGTLFWSGSSALDNANTGGSGTINSRFVASVDAGASYGQHFTFGALHLAVSGTPGSASVAAPEPATVIFLAITGLLPIAGAAIRKRNRMIDSLSRMRCSQVHVRR